MDFTASVSAFVLIHPSTHSLAPFLDKYCVLTENGTLPKGGLVLRVRMRGQESPEGHHAGSALPLRSTGLDSFSSVLNRFEGG